MKLGIEVECTLSEKPFLNNSPLSKSEHGSYHHPKKIKNNLFWETQSDSSIHCPNPMYNESIEITSVVFEEHQIDDVLTSFKSIFGEGELHEFLEFNSSCGMHIHFTPTTRVMDTNTYPSIAKYLRDNTYSLYKTLGYGGSMCTQYERSYAQKWEELPKEMLLSPPRTVDVNYTRFIESGYEWRSPHLLGVTTWEEFNALVKGYIDILIRMQTDKIPNIPVILNEEKVLCARYVTTYKTPYGRRRERYRTTNVVPMTDKIHCPLFIRSAVVIETSQEEEIECVI